MGLGSVCGTVGRLAGLLALCGGLGLLGWGPGVCLRGCLLKGRLPCGKPFVLPLDSCAAAQGSSRLGSGAEWWRSAEVTSERLYCGRLTTHLWPWAGKPVVRNSELTRARLGLDGALGYGGRADAGRRLASLLRLSTMRLAVTAVGLGGAAALVTLVALTLPCTVEKANVRPAIAITVFFRSLLVAAAAATAFFGSFSVHWDGRLRLWSSGRLAQLLAAPSHERLAYFSRGEDWDVSASEGQVVVVWGWLVASGLFLLALGLLATESCALCCCWEADEEDWEEGAADQAPAPSARLPANTGAPRPSSWTPARAPTPSARPPTVHFPKETHVSISITQDTDASTSSLDPPGPNYGKSGSSLDERGTFSVKDEGSSSDSGSSSPSPLRLRPASQPLPYADDREDPAHLYAPHQHRYP